MTTPLDLDQLQSFCAIADCGSFTEAARRVHKTQSAVSMQIKRLEERLGHALLSRDGRGVSAHPAWRGSSMRGRGRCCGPMPRSSTCSRTRTCSGSHPLRRAGRLCGAAAAGDPLELPEDASQDRRRCALPALRGAARGHEEGQLRPHRLHPGHQPASIGELFRTERDVLGRLAWRPGAAQDPLPIAGGQHCCWKDNAIEVLNRIGRDYRIAYTSSNAIAIASAVLTDLAVGFLPESALQPGHAGDRRGQGPAAPARCARSRIMRASHAYGGIYDALASHIVASMGNLDSKEPLAVAQAVSSPLHCHASFADLRIRSGAGRCG